MKEETRRRRALDLQRSVRAALWARWRLREADYVGPRVRLRGRPSVHNWGRMIVHDRVQLISTVATLELVANPGGTLEIGERSLVNYGTSIAASLSISIGAGSQLGTYNLLIDNDFHRLEPERRMERPESAPISLGENVWLGARVIVLPGVNIGAGSVVAAGSVVTRDVPARSLAAGMPARVVRQL